MTNAMETHQRQCKEMQLAGMIWWLMLWYASDEGKREVPGEQQWLSCELAAALIESVTGECMQYSWRFDHAGNECMHQWDVWPAELNRLLRAVDTRGNNEPEKKLRILMRRFVTYQFVHGHGEKDYSSELAYLHDTSTPRPTGRSRFTPDYMLFVQCDKYLAVDGYDTEQLQFVHQWCRKIGAIMQKYIDRDIAYIKQHYSW